MKSIEAECALAAAAMLDAPQVYADCAQVVESSDFTESLYRCIWLSAVKHGSKGQKIDPVIVSNEWPDIDLSLLVHESLSALHAVNSAHYAQIIADESMRRRSMEFFRKCATETKQAETCEVGNTLERLHGEMGAVCGRVEGEGRVNGEKALKDWSAVFRERYDAKDPVPYLASGIKELDLKTKGFKSGHSYCVAAGTGDGKTIFGTYLAANAAKSGKRVLYVSAEVPAIDIVERMIACQAVVNGEKLITGMATEEDLHRILHGLKTMKPWARAGLEILDKSSPSPADIEREVMAVKLNPTAQSFDLIVVDYVQLLRIPGFSGQRHEQLDMIGEELTAIAKRHNVAVVFLSQLSFDRYRQNGTTMPSHLHLAGSKYLANPCSGVICMWRPAKDRLETVTIPTEEGKRDVDTRGLVIFNVSKIRTGGREGVVCVKMEPQFQRFSEWVDAQSYPSDFDDIPPF